MKRLIYLLFIFLLVSSGVFISGCKKKKSTSLKTENKNVPNIKHSFVRYYPHSTNSFTEGLLFHDGKLFESTGAPDELPKTRSLFGTVDLNTGEINIKVELDRSQYFGEGITFLNDKVFQLTYKSKVGFIYDATTFKQIKEFTIPSKEGWGLTTDGNYLIMSDGTHVLTYLDANSLEVIKTVAVSENGFAKTKLNELEYINGYIYANIWMTNFIIKIDPKNGEVVGKLDLTSYANEAASIFPEALELNGIAYNPETGNTFVTGKLWPRIYEIKIEREEKPAPPV